MARPTRTDDRIGAMEPDAEDETSSHPLPLVEEEVEPAAPTGGRRLDTHEWIALAIGVLALCAGIFALVTADDDTASPLRSAEHTSELQSLMRISYAGFC